MDKKVKMIYTYLTNYVLDSDLKELITLLQDYVINGSYQDFENEEFLEDLDDKLTDLVF